VTGPRGIPEGRTALVTLPHTASEMSRAALACCTALALALSVGAAHGQSISTADEFLTMYRKSTGDYKVSMEILVEGFIRGVTVSNAFSEGQRKAPIICTDAAIGSQFAIQNMERLIRARPDLKTKIWEIAAFEALREAFPCERR
jgi:hypothetical protein